MRFAFLQLADAASAGPEGKLNALGLGVRVLTFESLPATSPLAIIGSVEASVGEGGEYGLAVSLIEPSGLEVLLVQAKATVVDDVADTRVPTGIGFSVGLLRPFEAEGVYAIRATVGPEVAEYLFVVRTGGSSSAGT